MNARTSVINEGPCSAEFAARICTIASAEAPSFHCRISGYLNARFSVQDIVQETVRSFARAKQEGQYAHLPEIELRRIVHAAMTNWCNKLVRQHTAAVRTPLSQTSHQTVEAALAVLKDENHPGPVEQLLSEERHDKLKRVLEHVAKDQPEWHVLIKRRFWDGQSWNVIAEELGWPLTKIMYERQRVLNRLREMLGEQL